MGDAGASSADVIRHDGYPDRISYRNRLVLSTEEKVATSHCKHQFNHLHNFVNAMLQYWTKHWVQEEAQITQILALMGPLNNMGAWNAMSGTQDLTDDLANLRLQDIDALADFVAVTWEQTFDGMVDFGGQDLVDRDRDGLVLFGPALLVAIDQLLARERLSTTHDSQGPWSRVQEFEYAMVSGYMRGLGVFGHMQQR
jgi:hypothetical protein